MGLHRALALPALLFSFLLGCQPASDAGPETAGSSGSAGASGNHAGGGSAGGSSSSGAGTAPLLRGSVVVSLVAPTDENEGHSTVLGRFFDGPTPSPIPLELDTEQGDCRLLVPSHPFCSTPCAPDVCTDDDVCTQYPSPLGVGSLAIAGLGTPLNIEPSTSMYVYQSPSLPYPPCNEGDAVSASAAGFTLSAECIAPLELSGADPIPVSAGSPVHVAWKPASTNASSRIRIGLDLAHHGGKKGEIDCDVADTGSFDIPEPLVTKLIGLGLAGYPTISVTRVSLGSDSSSPELSLLVSQSEQRAIDTGVTSCQEDAQCTAPEVCQMDKTCG